jgi:hypothetical protein
MKKSAHSRSNSAMHHAEQTSLSCLLQSIPLLRLSRARQQEAAELVVHEEPIVDLPPADQPAPLADSPNPTVGELLGEFLDLHP